MSKQVLAVIPARRASTRLPEKPLKLIAGKTLLERVYRLATNATSLSRVIVATDDSEIAELAKSFGAEVCMTSPECGTGTERVAEVAIKLGVANWEAVVNIQGDMPFLHPDLIDQTVKLLISIPQEAADSFDMTTLGSPLFDEHSALSPSVVKVVTTSGQRALYFSRAPIPHSRDGERLYLGGRKLFGIKHIGLYVFRPELLDFFQKTPPSELERVEMLEQLRALEAGYRIGVHIADPELTRLGLEIDTPADLLEAEKIAHVFDEKYRFF